jgi:ribosomal protein L7/L12
MERAAKFIPEETEVLKKAGLKIIQLSDADAKQFVQTTRDALWETLFKRDAETSKKLKQMISK